MRSNKKIIMFIIALLAVNFIYGQNYFERRIGLSNGEFISSLNNHSIYYFPSMINKNGFLFGDIDYEGNYDISLDINTSGFAFYIHNYNESQDTIISKIMPEFTKLNKMDLIFGYKSGKANYSAGISFNNNTMGGDSGNVAMKDINYMGGIENQTEISGKMLSIDFGIKVNDLKTYRNINDNVSKNDNRLGFGLNIMASLADDDNIYELYMTGYSKVFNFIYSDSIAAYNGKEIYSNNYGLNPGIGWCRNYSDYGDIKIYASYNFKYTSMNSYDDAGDTSEIVSIKQSLPNMDYEIEMNLFKDFYMSLFGNYNYEISESFVNGKKTLEKGSNFLYNVGVGYSNGDISVVIGGERLIENILESVKSNKLNIPLRLKFYYQIDNLTGI